MTELAGKAVTEALELLRSMLQEGYVLNDDQRRILYDVVSVTLDKATEGGPERAWDVLIPALYGEGRTARSTVVDATEMARLAKIIALVRRVKDGERSDELYDQIRHVLWS
jgi:hypothetical protein